MHTQNFIEIRLFILKILSKMHFGHESRAITQLKNKKKKNVIG